jgi:hypothetical protein
MLFLAHKLPDSDTERSRSFVWREGKREARILLQCEGGTIKRFNNQAVVRSIIIRVEAGHFTTHHEKKMEAANNALSLRDFLALTLDSE